MPRRIVKRRPAAAVPAAPATPPTLAEEQAEFTAEGAPPPGKVATEPPRLPKRRRPDQAA